MKTLELPIETMLPRLIDARIFEYEKGLAKKRRRRTYVYEIGFYLGGNGTIYIDDREYPIHYGDIRFTKPGARVNSSPQYRCYTLVFDFGENDTVYRNQILDSIPEYFSTNGELIKLVEEIIKSFRSNNVSEKLRCNALIMQLIYELFRLIYSKKKYSEAVRKCIGYMEEHFGESITLQRLGEISGYSHIHIMRMFRNETGQTPHEWLTEIRINHAKDLLSMSENTIEQIAEACGFRSDSHFKVLFRKITGLTPGNYRKNTNQIH